MRATILRRALLVAVVALGVVYLCDYAALRYRMARAGPNAAVGTVTVLYGAPLKDGKVRVFSDQPEIDTCVRSIFPHLGYAACWYARSHAIRIAN